MACSWTFGKYPLKYEKIFAIHRKLIAMDLQKKSLIEPGKKLFSLTSNYFAEGVRLPSP